MEDNQKTEKSQFFEAVTNAVDNATPLKTDADNLLLVMTDGVTVCHIVGGSADKLQTILLGFMRKNPNVADIVCRATLDYHALIMNDLKRVKTPPVPEDGLAMWPSIDKDKIGIDYAN